MTSDNPLGVWGRGPRPEYTKAARNNSHHTRSLQQQQQVRFGHDRRRTRTTDNIHNAVRAPIPTGTGILLLTALVSSYFIAPLVRVVGMR